MLEFGLRRAHGRGGNAGTRAALIGGANFSSNAGISHLLGYPPKGTHAHSMVQAFLALGMTELDAFQAYADTYPDECLFLVDTIDTLESGVPNAIRVFERLRKRGYSPVGVRLDSGDLAYLSVQTATMLDDAGFSDAAIVLSNDLDEINILQIKSEIGQEAARHGWTGTGLSIGWSMASALVLSRPPGTAPWAVCTSWSRLRTTAAGNPCSALGGSGQDAMPGGKRVWRIYDERRGAEGRSADIGRRKPRQTMANVRSSRCQPGAFCPIGPDAAASMGTGQKQSDGCRSDFLHRTAPGGCAG